MNDFTLTESIKSVYAIDLYIAVQESVFKFQIKNKILMERTVCVCVCVCAWRTTKKNCSYMKERVRSLTLRG